ncbi:GntR family transcriptional regulator [Kineococcus sp. NPDC059986]|jgi:GntR family transcriptional regulator|uniref:GntR family transcriptional regulator n=1 Tax=Kineococcus sp. NPDC059986 TaxID=3155538 RepID=UPI00344D79DF
MTPGPDSERLLDQILAMWDRSAATDGAAPAPLPSEPAVAAAVGASRNSVREAMIRLEERGYVHRSQGARTVLNHRLKGLGRRVDQQVDHAQAIAAAGHTPSVEILSAGSVQVDDDEDRFDDLPAGSPAFRTAKLWRADGVPYVHAEDLIPVRDADRVADVDPQDPVFDLAEHLNGVAVAWESVWFDPVLITGDLAERFEVGAPQAGLQLTYCGFGPLDDVAYWSREVQLAPVGRLRSALVRRVRRG